MSTNYTPSDIFTLKDDIYISNVASDVSKYSNTVDFPPSIFILKSPVFITIDTDLNENITIEFPINDGYFSDENEVSESTSHIIPKIIFIVPHRDMENQRDNFTRRMTYILEDIPRDEYEIFFVNQCDKRVFNRGAIKNIGFIAMRDKYPDNYKTISFVFNDVDTIPVDKNTFDYITLPGKIKHFYGVEGTLGGIFSVTGYDFERMDGFINLWSWGYEGNNIQMKADNLNILVTRDVFYLTDDKRIERTLDSQYRIVNRSEYDLYISNLVGGMSTIFNLVYDLDLVLGHVNVREFETDHREDISQTFEHDLKNGLVPFAPRKYTQRRGNTQMKMRF